jgi:hypothetical protein
LVIEANKVIQAPDENDADVTGDLAHMKAWRRQAVALRHRADRHRAEATDLANDAQEWAMKAEAGDSEAHKPADNTHRLLRRWRQAVARLVDGALGDQATDEVFRLELWVREAATDELVCRGSSTGPLYDRAADERASIASDLNHPAVQAYRDGETWLGDVPGYHRQWQSALAEPIWLDGRTATVMSPTGETYLRELPVGVIVVWSNQPRATSALPLERRFDTRKLLRALGDAGRIALDATCPAAPVIDIATTRCLNGHTEPGARVIVTIEIGQRPWSAYATQADTSGEWRIDLPEKTQPAPARIVTVGAGGNRFLTITVDLRDAPWEEPSPVHHLTNETPDSPETTG